MVQIKRIFAKNFKSLRDVDYRCSGLNILTGVNGSGKSSLMQTLLLMRYLGLREAGLCCAFRGSSVGLSGEISDMKYCYAEEYDVVRVGVECMGKCPSWGVKNCSSINGTITLDREIVAGSRGGMVAFHPAVRLAYGVNAADVALTLQDGALKISGAPAAKEGEEDRLSDIAKIEQENIRRTRQMWKRMRFIDAYRARPTEVSRDGCSCAVRGLVSGDCDPEGRDAAEILWTYGDKYWLREGNMMIREGSILDDIVPLASACGECGGSDGLPIRGSSLRNQVDAWLSVISTGASCHVEKYIVGTESRYVMSIAYGDSEDAKYIPQNVGFGVSNVLPILVTLLSAQPGDIIVIENPEAHLHPRGQSAIGELLARATSHGVQLFVETHSDHIINGVRAAVKEGILPSGEVSIAFVERKHQRSCSGENGLQDEVYSEIRNIRVDRRGALSEYPPEFLDEWNNQMMELML